MMLVHVARQRWAHMDTHMLGPFAKYDPIMLVPAA